MPLEVLLGDHPSLPELARALAQQPIEDWRSVWSGSTQEDSAARVVESWRLLVRLWEHIEDEIDGEKDPEHAWAGFHEELGRVLGALH
ncbi:MAG TPA: hypothetical protein VLT33_38730, partial [Labilithrix sp.]|nr:hypothetical protein [Labilithrix sp.]